MDANEHTSILRHDKGNSYVYVEDELLVRIALEICALILDHILQCMSRCFIQAIQLTGIKVWDERLQEIQVIMVVVTKTMMEGRNLQCLLSRMCCYRSSLINLTMLAKVGRRWRCCSSQTANACTASDRCPDSMCANGYPRKLDEHTGPVDR